MNSPFEINVESGIVSFPQLRSFLAPRLPLEEFLATDFGLRAKAERSSGGTLLYSLMQDLPDGRTLGIPLLFVDRLLSEIRINFRYERDRSWSNWSQERELNLVNQYQSEIARQLGKRGRFKWGIADAGYDDKAACAVLFISYPKVGEA